MNDLELITPGIKPKGKAYANCRPKAERPLGDFYGTPRSLTRLLIGTGILDSMRSILEPCAGDGRIAQELIKGLDKPRRLHCYDFYTMYGDRKKDFLTEEDTSYDGIVTNFPFSDWDPMIIHGLSISPKVVTIGKTNFIGAHGRNVRGLWDVCEKIYAFDRMVDYRTPDREDGCFYVGNLVTGWFVFNREHSGGPKLEVLDVSPWATLGSHPDSKKLKKKE